MAVLDLQDEATVDLIWQKGLKVDGYDADLYRQDFSGAWISRKAYGNRESVFGWEIDHIYPRSKGGTDEEVNLRPINWRNNISKGDSYPEYDAVIVSDGNKNIERMTPCTVSIALQARLKQLYGI